MTQEGLYRHLNAVQIEDEMRWREIRQMRKRMVVGE